MPNVRLPDPLRGKGADMAGLRPGWLTAGLIRLGILCAAIVAIGMLPFDVTPAGAGQVFFGGLLVVVVGLAVFAYETRSLAHRLGNLPGGRPVGRAILVLLRRTGLPLVGLAFFLAWTFLYMGLWWYAPTGPDAAFTGLAAEPRFADFFYYAVSTSFISPPGDILAHSRGARSATMIEMMTGFAVLTVYLSSFVDWTTPRRQPAPPGGDEIEP